MTMAVVGQPLAGRRQELPATSGLGAIGPSLPSFPVIFLRRETAGQLRGVGKVQGFLEKRESIHNKTQKIKRPTGLYPICSKYRIS